MERVLESLAARLGILIGSLLGRLPIAWQRRIGRGLGGLIFRLSSRRRRIAEQNLMLCFPDWTPAERIAVVQRFFENFACALLDLFWLWQRPAGQITDRVRWRGEEHLRQAEAAGSGPLIILAPHFLGIDAGGTRLQIERPLVCLYSNQSIPVIDAWIIRGRARFHQATLVSRREGIGRLARLLRGGMAAHFSPDMDFGTRGSVFVPFFGQPAATPTSLVRLAQLTNARVVPMITRLSPEGYESTFYPGWQYQANDDVTAAVAALNQKIESWICEDPSQYLWTHRRFKTRPDGLPSVYS
ncbi:MAG: hypothetical protein RLZZ344_622 [Pseudomonadota bacterium]|jgi:KDO2-lipid IV(A) lauroyltransferase